MATGMDWVQACNTASKRPVPEMRRGCNAANSVAISAYAVAAVFCATFFLLDYRLLLWRRSGKEVDGDRVWKNLRRFSGWMFASCVAGIVLFSFNLQSDTFYFDSLEPGITRRQFYESSSADQIYELVAFDIMYPVQLLCFIYALTTLLRRVSDHASHSYYNVARDLNRTTETTRKKFDWRDCIGQYALYYWVRSMHVIAMVGCSLYLMLCVVVAGFRAEAAGVLNLAAASTDVNGRDTVTSELYFNTTLLDAKDRKNKTFAAASAIEAATLVFVASGFVLFFPAIIVMFCRVQAKMKGLILEMDNRSDVGNAFLPVEFSPLAADGSVTQTEMPIVEVRRYLRDIEAAAALQRRRFLLCLVLVMGALLALTLLAVFEASFASNSKLNPDCGPCESCQNAEHFMFVWYTLAFLPVGFPLLWSISSALPLMFSLWLMTTPEDRALLLHPHRFLSKGTSISLGALLQPVQNEREKNLYAERLRLGIELL